MSLVYHITKNSLIVFLRNDRLERPLWNNLREGTDSQIDLKYVILLMEEIRLTSWYGRYPIFHMVFYITGDAMLLPSTVPYTIGVWIHISSIILQKSSIITCFSYGFSWVVAWGPHQTHHPPSSPSTIHRGFSFVSTQRIRRTSLRSTIAPLPSGTLPEKNP